MPSSHTHEFEDNLDYIFEDVLVAEEITCTSEYCSETQVTQYKVDFTSFVKDGDTLLEKSAETVWERICTKFGDIIPIRKQWKSDSIEIETQHGTITFYYDTNFEELQSVQIVFNENGSAVRFDVEHYRQL